MNINYLSVKSDVPSKGYWDMTFIEDLVKDLPDGERKLFLIPGAYQADVVREINEILQKHDKVFVVITSDEEGKFPCSKLSHSDMIHYCQYGNCDRPFPIGYTPQARPLLKEIGLQDKTLRYFFAGQLNSPERIELATKLVQIDKGMFLGTSGFYQGFTDKEYFSYLSKAVYAPAPGGHISPDSFRFYEGLEAGCHVVDYPPYMKILFPDIPDKDQFTWWIGKKVELRNKLRTELECPQEATTAVITTSPIKSHPDTSMIEETIKSIRHFLTSDIIIAIDGVRSEQEEYKARYEEYKRRLLWKCNFEYENIIPVVFDEHKHQSGMIKEILPRIKTPFLLFVEHDTPLTTDRDIDFLFIQKTLLKADAYCIRFHYEEKIPKEHEYLMIGDVDNNLLKTRQWSQRPHIARTDFYKQIMSLFSEKANCFIEDRVYTFLENGNWDEWRTFIYHPKGGIKRSLNLDGRGDDKKYDENQVW